MFGRECKLFRRLLAYQNETVEQFGITAMFFKGVFMKKYRAIGMTLLDLSFFQVKLDHAEDNLDPMDCLVFFYQAVR